jgi:hypothetical protein
VAIAAADKAVEATKKLMAKADALAMDWETGVVRGLSSAEVGSLGLKAGEVGTCMTSHAERSHWRPANVSSG